jgi:D-alanine-D-alanine ligase
MKKKIRVGLIFGGKSAEHEVSLQSARSIAEALDKEKYEIIPIGIDKKGRWYFLPRTNFLLNENDPKTISLNKLSDRVAVLQGEKQIVSVNKKTEKKAVDIAFPILHGPFGEDGTVQGLLKLADIPFVGAGVLGSAVGMDKDVMKRLLRDAGIPIAGFKVLFSCNRKEICFEETVKDLGLPFFIKPANLGSSVGVSRVEDEAQFKKAIDTAFLYDNKIIIEECIQGREIECSVLGNENPQASVPGEVLPNDNFYSYEAKYIKEDGAILEIPAKLNEETTKRIQELAVETFRVLCCEGLARIDFFLAGGSNVYVNEINTLPGFTKISMYPKLWEASGLSYSKLLDRLIDLAFERKQKEDRLKTLTSI